MTDKKIRLCFNAHGLGDCVHAATAMRLYIKRGFDVAIAVENNKRWIWNAAGIPIYDGPEQLPLHPYYYPDTFGNLAVPEFNSSKIAHFFEIAELPKLGSKQEVWDMLCRERVDVSSTIRAEYLAAADELLDGLPRPVVLLHSKGTNLQSQKSIPDQDVVELIRILLHPDSGFSGSIVTLDFDSRAATVGHARCRPVVPAWTEINAEKICALYCKADLLVGVDSGPFHMAAFTPIQCLGVFRQIHPVQCCIPNPNATYMVSAEHHTYWQLRGSEWRFLEYAKAEPTATEIANAIKSLVRPKVVQQTAKTTVLVNTDRGPYFNGVGDAILLSWLAEGSKGSDCELKLHADGFKWQCLDMLGQDLSPDQGGVSPSPIYEREKRERGLTSRMQVAAEVLGIKTPARRPQVRLSERAKLFAVQFWGDRNGNGKRVLFCPESNDPTRNWPHWDQLESKLASTSASVRSIDKNKASMNWQIVAAVISLADVVVAVDSAHAHIAATVGVPTIVLMGPTTNCTFSHATNVTCLHVPSTTLACVGCSYASPCNQECYNGGCVALSRLTSAVVFDEVSKHLSQPGKPTMMYRTYAQLAEDVRRWCRVLPPFAAVAGIPRAGVIVASMIAAERNIHLVTLDELRAGRRPWESPLRRNCPARPNGDVLIVDDTVATGGHMRPIRQEFTDPRFKFAAAYGMDTGLGEVDFVCEKVGMIDHVFEWNWQHHWFVENSLFDLDGVLCEDWPYLHETGSLEGRYQEHLSQARPLIVPSFPIGEIVTARLEKFRPQTEEWLHRNGIRFKALTMGPYSSPEERAANGGFAERKAQIYAERPWARMFVESNHNQATAIAQITGRPVLSWEKQVMLNGAK